MHAAAAPLILLAPVTAAAASAASGAAMSGPVIGCPFASSDQPAASTVRSATEEWGALVGARRAAAVEMGFPPATGTTFRSCHVDLGAYLPGARASTPSLLWVEPVGAGASKRSPAPTGVGCTGSVGDQPSLADPGWTTLALTHRDEVTTKGQDHPVGVDGPYAGLCPYDRSREQP